MLDASGVRRWGFICHWTQENRAELCHLCVHETERESGGGGDMADWIYEGGEQRRSRFNAADLLIPQEGGGSLSTR